MLSWVDPLRLTLEAGLTGRDSSLLVARQNFGSEAHFRFLVDVLSRECLPPGSPAVIDLTPFQRLGNRTAFRNLLVSGGLLTDKFLLVASQTLYDDLVTVAPEIGEEGELPVIFFELNEGQLTARESGAFNRLFAYVASDDIRPQKCTYSKLRIGVTEAELLERIKAVTLKAPDERWKGETEVLADDYFLKMPNGMLVTHFVLMKDLLHEVGPVDRIAYEVAAHACQGFCSELDERWPDLFVASSDHSYLIGAAAQRLTGIKCAVIDRIGLLPGRRLTRDTISLDVTGKRVALIVDVSATASEMERAASLLIHRGAHLQVIVCCVWFECALPKFVDWFQFVPLSRPKTRLRYVYRSAP